MGAAQDRQDVHEMRVELSIRQWDRVVTAFLAAARTLRGQGVPWVFALGRYNLVKDALVVWALPETAGDPENAIRIDIRAASVWPWVKENRWQDVANGFHHAMEATVREQPP